MRSRGAALAVFAALAVWPAAASAAEQTFCVSDPTCAGTPEASVANALAAAQANGSERDRIKVGPGTFPATATLSDALNNPVLIEGAGESATVLTRTPAAAQPVLVLDNAQSGVSKLTLHIPAGQPNMTGVTLVGGAFGERLRITSPAATADATGISVLNGSSLRRSVVTLPNTTVASNDGIVAGDNAVVESSGVSATRGVAILGSGALIRGARVTARMGVELHGTFGMDRTATVENTQVNTLVPQGSGDAAFKAQAENTSTAVTLSARHVTLIGPGSGIGFNADAHASGPNSVSTLNILDSIVRGYATDLKSAQGPSGSASLNIDDSAFDFAKTVGGMFATVNPGPNNINLNSLDPKLRDFHGDKRPGFDSALVDRGVPGGLLITESAFDLALLPRLVDGNGDGTARRDMGAFEYQRAAPVVTATAAPATAGQGQAITFSASATDTDPEETPGEISWTFDDGATSAGASVQHAFASAGAHTATARATDPAGVTGAGIATVTIADTTAPALRISKRAVTLTRKGVARVALTCPETEVSGPCQGKLTLTSARKLERAGHARARKIKLGSARFRIAAGRKAKVKIKLSKANRTLVVRLRRVRVSAGAAVHDQVGNNLTVKGRFKLRARASK